MLGGGFQGTNRVFILCLQTMSTCKDADCFVFTSSPKRREKGLEFLLLSILPDPKVPGPLLRADRTHNNHVSLLARGIFDVTAAADNLHLHKLKA